MIEGIGAGEVLLSSLFIAYESAFSYSQFMPSLFTIRQFRDDWGGVQALRHGEIIGSVFTLSFAALFSFVLRSPLPMLFAVLSCGFVLAVYEWAIRRPGND